MLGLYLHIPFCSAICNYCNFNRGLFDADLKARYVDALLREIGSSSARHDRPCADTIYFGGGTPSLLEPEEISRIIRACEDAFDLPPHREVTLEANPETVTVDRLARYRAAGVNRLSFGVQSFRNEELQRLSRLHGAERARQAVAEARAAGFDNVSLDLMMWLPGQKVAEWLQSVDEAAALEPEHLSLYLLEVYPNAPLKDEMARQRWSQAPDEDAATMYVAGLERLEAAGFEQYRDLERGHARTPVASQSQILERRRVARVWLRRALDIWRHQVEERLLNRGLRASNRAPRADRRRRSPA